MQTTATKHGEILSPVLWAKLADEYLNPVHEGSNADAQRNARILGEYVDQQVHTVQPFWYRYLGVNWVATVDPEPYDGLAAMSDDYNRAARDRKHEVLVSSQYCDHPVWSEETNVRFRVWHDTGHVLSGNGFDVDGELRLFAAQARTMLETGPNGQYVSTKYLVDALFSESVYQLAACVHLDGFPDQQYVRTPGPVGRLVLQLLLQL